MNESDCRWSFLYTYTYIIIVYKHGCAWIVGGCAVVFSVWRFATAFKRDSLLLHSSNTYRTLCFTITLCFSCFSVSVQFYFTYVYLLFFFFCLFVWRVYVLHAGSGGFCFSFLGVSLRSGDERRPREKRWKTRLSSDSSRRYRFAFYVPILASTNASRSDTPRRRGARCRVKNRYDWSRWKVPLEKTNYRTLSISFLSFFLF